MLRAEPFFGSTVAGRHSVSERRWAQLLKREIALRFPGGPIAIEAHGKWRDPQRGTLVRELAKIVIVVTTDDVSARERIEAAAAAYKQRFKQKSVGIVTRSVCAAF